MGRRSITRIDPGQAVRVRLRMDASERTLVSYVVRVDSEFLQIALPLDEPGLAAHPPASPLEISFLKQGLYFHFQSRVEACVKGERPAWVVRRPEPEGVEIVNRRGQNRCPLKIAVLCHQLVPESAEAKWAKGYLMDLSTGGARLVCEEPLLSHSPLSMEFYLGQIQEPVLVQGEVVRQISQHPPHYGYGVRFRSIPEQFRENLVEFLY